MKFFIDSSAFISLLVTNQITHKETVSFFRELKEQNTMLFTSDLVLSESFTWLLYKNGLRVALGLKEMIGRAKKEGFLEIFWFDDLFYEECWTYFPKFSEHKLSFTDAFSYLLVKKFRLDGIFTFDKSFKKVGLSVKP